jgi:hypothetical protein
VSAGNLVSLRLLSADPAVSYVFGSRTNGTIDARPQLAITAVPEPAGGVLAFLGAATTAVIRRNRR